MKFPLFSFLAHPRVRLITFLLMGMIIVQVGYLALKWTSLPPEVPLFYSYPEGEKQLVPAFMLILLPIMTLSVGILNGLIATLFFSEETLLSLILSWSTTMVGLITTIGLFEIIHLIS